MKFCEQDDDIEIPKNESRNINKISTFKEFSKYHTPDFSSLKRNPSIVTWIVILCLCSPAARIAIFRSCSASWHIRSPLASPTSKMPINLALNMTPSPKNLAGSFRSKVNKQIVIYLHFIN